MNNDYEIRSEVKDGELKAVLYTDSGEFIRVLEEDAYGIKVPHSLMEKLRDPRKVRVPPKTHKQIRNGFWGTLLGIGALILLLSSRERERQEERMERELDRIRRITER